MKSIGFKLVGAAAFCCALFAQGAVTWRNVGAGTTLTIPCGTGQNSVNLNGGRADGFNLCCDDGSTIAVTDLASGKGAKLFSTIVATNGTAPGDYPLVAYGALAEGTTFSLDAQGFGGARPILVKALTGLVLHVAPSGMTVIFR